MVKVEEELTKLDKVSIHYMKPSSRIKRPPNLMLSWERETPDTLYALREELSDVVLKTLGNPGASRRNFGCSTPWE